MAGIVKKIFLCFFLLLFVFSPFCQSQAFFTGATFEDRKNSYLKNADTKFSANYPASMIQSVWAWLENPVGREKQISEEINYLIGPCTGNLLRWKNCWWSGDEPDIIFAARIYFQYYKNKKVISDVDAAKLKDKLATIAYSQSVFCAVSNYLFRRLVIAYLYATLVQDFDIVYPKATDLVDGQPLYSCLPAELTYNGHTYRVGQTYRASQLFGDYLGVQIDRLLLQGDQEDLSSNGYYYAQISSFALLYDFSVDSLMKRKAKMILDWLIFQHAVNFSAYHDAGGHGRIYQWDEGEPANFFPWFIFYNLDQKSVNLLTRDNAFTELYVTTYRHPKLLTDIFESLNGANASEGDDYYRIVRGRVPAIGPGETPDPPPFPYRYDYVTPLYNLGGSGIGTGWELNIKTNGGVVKLYINNCEENSISGKKQSACLAPGPQMGYGIFNLIKMGGISAVSQYRNSLFMARDAAFIWTYPLSVNWDEKSYENGWNFYRLGKVAIAVMVPKLSWWPAAVEVAIVGVDYPTYSEFKTAVKTQAKLDVSKNEFINSKGFKLTKGFIDYPSDNPEKKPFDRLEVWEGHSGKGDEVKIVDWDNNVMTVRKGDLFCIYNFNNWTYNGNGCEGESVAVEKTPDFNCDSTVDVSDFGILLSFWGRTADLDKFYSPHCGLDHKKNLDLFSDGRIDSKDVAQLFSCWGTAVGACQ